MRFWNKHFWQTNDEFWSIRQCPTSNSSLMTSGNNLNWHVTSYFLPLLLILMQYLKRKELKKQTTSFAFIYIYLLPADYRVEKKIIFKALLIMGKDRDLCPTLELKDIFWAVSQRHHKLRGNVVFRVIITLFYSKTDIGTFSYGYSFGVPELIQNQNRHDKNAHFLLLWLVTNSNARI